MSAIAPLLDQLCDGDVVDTSDLALVSDSNPRSVARWRTEGTAPQREAEDRLLELRSVVDLACRVIQRDAVRLWLRAPNSELDYEKPLELIAKGEYKRVVGLLLALAEGVTA
ncbi:antitoxin Xre/MbcA/ParS toxin-binding domain-containing protein [Candidatus Poriferisodalis sp.]|uniref:antitoxin Xre/MbcA/ParS toxin-binding domain-containing protein n=1 Tax=Candidatus Poriferisodalis sp. TaxID=3101277 RepID=UPI003B590829